MLAVECFSRRKSRKYETADLRSEASQIQGHPGEKMDIKTTNGSIDEKVIIANAMAILTRVRKRQQDLPGYLDKPLSKETIEGYRTEVKRLTKHTVDVASIIIKAKSTCSLRTWYRRKAALIWCSMAELSRLAIDKNGELQKVSVEDLSKLVRHTNLLDAIDRELPPAKESRKPAHGKRKDLRGLPDDWRQQILDLMPNYRLPILTLAITGCRPAELVKGVEWTLVNDKLHAVIHGAKVTKYAGQTIRELIYPVEPGMSMALADILRENNGSLRVTVKSAGSITWAIRSVGKRAFPKFKKAITAYCFRHQVAADEKANSQGSEDPKAAMLTLSALLGHAVDRTRGYYGHQKQARSGGVSPEKVVASKEVKQKNPVDYSLLNNSKAWDIKSSPKLW
jgi:integrase